MRFFYKLTLSTLVAVYVLILVGGIVRSTGSGMGCPDWPKCFGSWTPPTSVDDLPENYKEIYSEYRHKKNVKFAQYLSTLGFDDTANKILQDQSIRSESDFNPVKTWIEYLNRIVGVIIGILIFAVFVASFRFWSSDKGITLVSGLTFLLVGFQGWIGSFVVSTNLTPWTVTVHMFLAMVIVAMLFYILHRVDDPARTQVPGVTSSTQFLLIAAIIILLVQILLGTQVREAVDRIATETESRHNWVAALGLEFFIHRSFSWIVLIINVILVIKLWKSGPLKGFNLGVILLILGTLLTGVGMAWFSVPPFLQPVHLLLATSAFGVQFLLILWVRRNVNLS